MRKQRCEVKVFSTLHHTKLQILKYKSIQSEFYRNTSPVLRLFTGSCTRLPIFCTVKQEVVITRAQKFFQGVQH